jgi:hypothetical protein
MGHYVLNVNLAGSATIAIAGPCQHRRTARATFVPEMIEPILSLLPDLAPQYPMPEMSNPHDEVDIVTQRLTFVSVGSYWGAPAAVHARLDQFAHDLAWSPPVNFGTGCRRE